MKEIQPLESQSLQTRDFESLKTLRLACRAQNTRKAYNKGWKRFNQWLIDTGRKISEPPEGKHELLIALFVRDMTLNENLKPSTINTYVSGVKYGYRENEIEVNIAHPIIADLLSASRRIKGSAADQKSPITVEHVREIVDLMGDSPMDCRDRALILLGFGGAFRRSELVALDIDDLQFDHDGLRVRLKRSKTDQDGKTRYVDIPRILNGSYCAYEALNKYMDVCGIKEGALFRSFSLNKEMQGRLTCRSVARIIQKWGARIGLENVSGHSLRAGYVTSAVDAEVPDSQIMRQTGHKCSSTLRIYDRFLQNYRNNGLRKIYRRLRRI